MIIRTGDVEADWRNLRIDIDRGAVSAADLYKFAGELFAELVRDRKAAEDESEDLRDDINDLESQVATLESDLEAAEEKIAELKAELAELKAKGDDE